MGIACPICLEMPDKADNLIRKEGECPVKGPERGHTLAPWVRIRLLGENGKCLTVGNDSSPHTNPQHVAVIKDFEYGFSDGFTVRVKMQDQQGGMLETFCSHLLHHVGCLDHVYPPNRSMKFEWGWAKAGCDKPFPGSRSPCHLAIITSIETTYTQGLFIADLTGKDGGHPMMMLYSDKIEGSTEEKGTCLTHAIRACLTSDPPAKVTKVDFSRMEGGVEFPCGFEWFDWDCRCEKFGRGHAFDNGAIASGCNLDGPRGGWSTEGQDKLQAVRRWISNWRTDRLKQWIMEWDSANGRLVFWEDRAPVCSAQSKQYWQSNCVGYYVVNGGKGSPVLEFNPRVKWNFGAGPLSNIGGITADKIGPFPETKETGGTAQFGNAKAKGRAECPPLQRPDNPGSGHTAQVPIDKATRAFHMARSGEEAAKAQEQQYKSMPLAMQPITADLVIIGDPTIMPPGVAMAGKTCTLVVRSPYFITEKNKSDFATSGQKQLDWLSNPEIHPVFTNSAWRVKSIMHRIEAGRYTTTLTLFLGAPGIDGDPNAPWGLASDGWTPPPCN